MAFVFQKPVDPEQPLDDSDLPPEGWSTVDAKDHSKALFGFAPETFRKCVAWGEREAKRHLNSQKSSVR